MNSTVIAAATRARADSTGPAEEPVVRARVDTDEFRIPSILLIEDNPGDIELEMLALEANGVIADFRIVRTGEQALELLRRTSAEDRAWRPSVILLDLNVPGPSGLQLLAYIKQHADLRRTPTVIVTSSDLWRDRRRCFELGADGYVCKQRTLPELQDALKVIEPLL